MLVFSPLSHMDCQLHTGRAWDLWRAGFWVFLLAGAKTQFSRKTTGFHTKLLVRSGVSVVKDLSLGLV